MNTLTQELVKELFDYRDGKLYWKTDRGTNKLKGLRAGSDTFHGYRVIVINRKLYKEHRLVFLLHRGYLPNFLDHINGEKNDNRIENLRPATALENNRNAKIRVDNTSGAKGVSWHSSGKKWQATININGKLTYLGLFKTMNEAVETVKKAREQHHKEFARYE